MSTRKFSGVSPSQLDAMGCRQQWKWGYPEGYRPKKAAIPLELGDGIHQALEHHYEGNRTGTVDYFENWSYNRINQLGIEADEKFIAAMELGRMMLEEYVAEYENKDNFEVIATEKTIRHKLPTPTGGRSKYSLTARLDGLVRMLDTGKIFSLEHKTYARLDTRSMEMNHQFTAQIWLGKYMAEALGLEEHVQGVIYNGLRKQAPGPRVKAPLFHREFLYRTESEIAAMLHRAYWACREFSKKSLAIYPQPNPIRCSMCDFREVCLEKQRGGDWEFLLEENFTRRDSGEDCDATTQTKN